MATKLEFLELVSARVIFNDGKVVKLLTIDDGDVGVFFREAETDQEWYRDWVLGSLVELERFPIRVN